MGEEYIAIIKMFAGNFAPRSFQFCQGQLLNINTNSALFTLLGTNFGGNGVQTFGLPDLRGRVPVGTTGLESVPGLPNIVLGEIGGVPNTTLLVSNLPGHNHTINVSDAKPTESTPVGNLLTVSPSVGSGPNATQLKSYAKVPTQGSETTLKPMAAQATGITGANIPVSIMQPYLGINYVITTEGVFPSRQ